MRNLFFGILVILSGISFAKSEGPVLCYNVTTKAPEETRSEKPVKVTERYCKKPDDCTSVLGLCGRCVLAVNKMEVKNVDARMKKLTSTANCSVGTPPKVEAVCQKRMCIVVDNNETAPATEAAPVPPTDAAPVPMPDPNALTK